MKRTILIATSALALVLGFSTASLGATGDGYGGDDPNGFTTCANLKGWYANPDEQDDLPTPTEAGLRFEAKDLIHHKTEPIDFADMDKVSYSFASTKDGKVVFKVETSGPYSTIVTNADGKLWSTAMLPEQDGGQNKPLDKYSDFIGKPVKPGKTSYDGKSAVVTFGVGYWTADGDTVVSQIKFHGETYPLTCKRSSPLPTVTATATATTKPTATATSKPTATATKTTSPAAGVAAPGGAQAGPSLPVTGPSIGWVIGSGAAIVLAGAALLVLTRRRRIAFSQE